MIKPRILTIYEHTEISIRALYLIDTFQDMVFIRKGWSW